MPSFAAFNVAPSLRHSRPLPSDVTNNLVLNRPLQRVGGALQVSTGEIDLTLNGALGAVGGSLSMTSSLDHTLSGALGNVGAGTMAISLDDLPPPGAGEHRYWRVLVNSANGAPGIDPGEVYFMFEGSRITGGTPSASSTFPGADINAAFDGNTLSRWSSDFGGSWPQWVAYDFGTDVEIDAVGISAGQGPTRYPSSFDIEYSDDGSTWTVASSQTNIAGLAPGAFAAHPVYYPVDPAISYAWRITFTTHTDVTDIKELELMVGGSDITDTEPRWVRTSNQYWEPATQAFDNDAMTNWVTNEYGGEYIEHWFDRHVDVDAITVQVQQAARPPQRIKLSYSDDAGATWTDVADWNSIPAWSDGEKRTFTV